ncbi:MAG: MOSC domain-containing protein, partial [Sphingomonadales bacterium]
MHVIDAVLTGRIVPFGPDGETSAIDKTRVAGPQTVGFFGIEGDQQADPSVHGGRDKAIHHYPR